MTDAWQTLSGIGPPRPPSPRRYSRPDRLYDAERPCALQKAIDRAERAGTGERQNEPGAAVFQRVEDQHGGDGEQAEGRQRVHQARADFPRSARNAVEDSGDFSPCRNTQTGGRR